MLYVDFENDPKVDTRDRSKPWATPPDLGNLVVLSFPTMSALDTPAGRRRAHRRRIRLRLRRRRHRHRVARHPRREENENDTWLNFYRHTGLAIKQAGLALIRLDHTARTRRRAARRLREVRRRGRDLAVPAKVSDAVFRLDCEAARLPIAEKTLVLHRETSPRLRHRVDAAGAAAAQGEGRRADRALDDNQVPDDASVRDVRAWKNGRGLKASNQVIEEAVRVRKARLGAFEVDR